MLKQIIAKAEEQAEEGYLHISSVKALLLELDTFHQNKGTKLSGIKNKNGIGKNGVSTIKRQDFIDRYKPLLDDGMGHTRKNTILGLPLEEYYWMGLFCIDNEISITGFLQLAYKERKALCEMKLLKATEDNTNYLCSTIKRKNKQATTVSNSQQGISNEQGVLFWTYQ